MNRKMSRFIAKCSDFWQNDLKAIVSELQNEYYDKFKDSNVFDLKMLNVIKYFQENLCCTEKEVEAKMPQTQYAELFKWIYLNYQNRLLLLNALDFNSIVMLAYHLFTTNSMVSKLYRISYKYICIDEFQDTNLAQYNLIKSFIKKDKSNLFIVSDDDQVIYGWNGASNKRLIDYKLETMIKIKGERQHRLINAAERELLLKIDKMCMKKFNLKSLDDVDKLSYNGIYHELSNYRNKLLEEESNIEFHYKVYDIVINHSFIEEDKKDLTITSHTIM